MLKLSNLTRTLLIPKQKLHIPFFKRLKSDPKLLISDDKISYYVDESNKVTSRMNTNVTLPCRCFLSEWSS